jgi:16S rRNA (cytidine1402-2'-O)-methyltransferase
MNESGKLSVVATPIGNMGDITLRAIETLKNCDVIFCEDTRMIGKLLERLGLPKKDLVRADAEKENRVANYALDLLALGKNLVYVSDAGTPGISDPGARLVAEVRREAPDVLIEAIPGPSSVTAALSIAGLKENSFTFLGFVPHKKGGGGAVG